MHKNKIFIIFLSGMVLALILWAISALVVNKYFAPKTQAESQQLSEVPQEERVFPARILSVGQLGNEFNLKGTGISGSGVTLLHNKEELGTGVVSAGGEWSVEFISKPTPNAREPNALELSLLMVTPNGHQIYSDQSLILMYPPTAPKEGEQSPEQKAMIFLTSPGQNTRVLQTSFDFLPGRDGFVLEAIDYDNSGGVIFSGLSVQMGSVKVYANENLVGESYVDRSGRWELIFGNIMPMGTYNISVELVPIGQGIIDEKPKSSIVLTLPFARMSPLFASEDSPEILVEYLDDRIQIGRALYGGGYQFTIVYSPDAVVE